MAEDRQQDRRTESALDTANLAQELAASVGARERRAVARALTEAERQSSLAAELLSELKEHVGRALVIGFTGPPGAGKSTLVDAYVREVRRRGLTTGVIAVDPSSPVSGGDKRRLRSEEHTSELQSRENLVCRLLLEKKKKNNSTQLAPMRH